MKIAQILGKLSLFSIIFTISVTKKIKSVIRVYRGFLIPLNEHKQEILTRAFCNFMIRKLYNMKNKDVSVMDTNLQMLSLKDVAAKTKLSEPHLRKLLKVGYFPKPVPLIEGEKPKLFFLESEIDLWLKNKCELRGDA